MTVLKKIVVAIFAFNLALMVVSQIEVTPGVMMATEIGYNTMILTVFNDTMQNINITNIAITNSFSPNATGGETLGICLQPVLPFFRVCVINAAGSFPSIMDRIGIIVVSISNIVGNTILLIFLLIYNSTIGSIQLYTSLFSLISPGLGGFLGMALGSIQSILIFWGLIGFIPQVGNKRDQ